MLKPKNKNINRTCRLDNTRVNPNPSCLLNFHRELRSIYICVCAVISGLPEVFSCGALEPDGQENHGADRASAGIRAVLAGAPKVPNNPGEENS